MSARRNQEPCADYPESIRAKYQLMAHVRLAAKACVDHDPYESAEIGWVLLGGFLANLYEYREELPEIVTVRKPRLLLLALDYFNDFTRPINIFDLEEPDLVQDLAERTARVALYREALFALFSEHEENFRGNPLIAVH
jgi:hypothetical protein